VEWLASTARGKPTATATSASGGASASKDPGQAALNWARCMRQHGINLPDPQITRDGIDQQLPSRAQTKSPKFKAADQACRKQLPNGGQPTAQEQQQALARALAFARCMRQHGANMPDPQITADGIGQEWPDPPERDTPKFRAAQQTCERAVPPARQ
jgi:hypothetical protein